MLTPPNPVPKPDPIDRKRQRYNKAEKFRNQVWREQRAGIYWYDGKQREWGVCFRCDCTVIRGIDGEVDHIKPRSTAPELIYEPSNGRISCSICNQRRKTNWRERV